ncbi:uncharacterized protein J7T54_002608 [Emericellopsis cladophorae]|uniref:LEA domain protein n=1 Tax=Emericellopsis cladophorae TaxID=2686198 RepID=A0A9P9XWG7_9HYPO|nr:uncharacterized protein J7T54_002608 [Emericellopsis cladophorae]KAI6778966.1 hypothetical protein J7T54_002608 [Emericellopsis cladophorae]
MPEPEPEPEQQGSPGPSPPTPTPTHTTHTFDVPYRAGTSFTPTSADAEPRAPAHIEPIPRIALGDGSSPQAPSQSEQRRAQRRETAGLAEGLEGKYVDEFGNVLDWDGTVKGRVEGDLPSMVGRPVSANGDVLDAEGEVVGHVSENHDQPPLKELDGGLRVDDMGNIYSADGSIIGKLNEPPPKKADEEKPQEQEKQPEAEKKKPCGCSAPQPASAPRPSEIYLDVKSTFDGIQIILKIPTIFNQEQQQQQKQETSQRGEESRSRSRSKSKSRSRGRSRSKEQGRGDEQASSNVTCEP